MEVSKKSLYGRTIKGGFWVFSLKISQRILQIVKLVIVARIINPHGFGLLGIALLITMAMETLSQTGFDRALIQRRGDIHPYLNVAWTAAVVRGIVLFSAIYLVAPYIASFFNVREVQPIIRVIGISYVLQGFNNIGVIYFRKEIEFKKEFFYQLSGFLADFIVTIGFVLVLRNVWALVFGNLAGHLTRLIASYLIHPLRPKFRFELDKLEKLLNFGKWIFGSSILTFLIVSGDDFFVGKLLGATALGFYQMAYKISNISATEITQVMAQVVFPVYSKMQDNIARLRESYLRVLQLTAFLSMPLAGILFILAPDLTKVLLGEKWLPMVGAMRLLAVWGGMRAVAATSGSVFLGVGRPKILAKIQFLNLILILALIYPFTMRWSIEGTALAIILATVLPILFAFKAVCRITKCKFMNLFKNITFPLIATLIMSKGAVILKSIWFAKASISGIIFSVISAAMIYLGVTFIFDKLFNCKMQLMLKDSWKQLRKNRNVR